MAAFLISEFLYYLPTR